MSQLRTSPSAANLQAMEEHALTRYDVIEDLRLEILDLKDDLYNIEILSIDRTGNPISDDNDKKREMEEIEEEIKLNESSIIRIFNFIRHWNEQIATMRRAIESQRTVIRSAKSPKKKKGSKKKKKKKKGSKNKKRKRTVRRKKR
jgi:hypothetical protein